MITFKEWLLTESITDEMREWFYKRTKEHISKVQHYAKKIEQALPEYNGVYQQSLEHDKNKFEEPCLTPYIHITWKYKTNGEYKIPDNVDDTYITNYHVKTNKHHPEYWCDIENTINPNDRDKPLVLIDGTTMDKISLAEMCADWCAVSSERGGNPQGWGKKNINIRWKFTKDQEDAIYNILDNVWG